MCNILYTYLLHNMVYTGYTVCIINHGCDEPKCVYNYFKYPNQFIYITTF